ncbi:hypothetical protein [Actinopolymorpha alba]|uniref:hypothetical protein n=1 Tax=Actinopolymorpha alba TaxID=533267 RepID=UPI000372B978|nr:hypothetical protein [Actinopolymorpha alba]
MAGDSQAAVHEALQRVEEELAELRRSINDVRRRIAERWDSPTDPADLASALTTVEEQEALIESLEARRRHLRQKLGLPAES